MATYRVVCEQDEDGWWVGRVAGVAGVVTQGRSLATIKTRIREALSLAVDDAKTAKLELDVKMPEALRRCVRLLQEARANLEAITDQAREIERETAKKLTKRMSVRDAGEVLHLTGQRVQQLTKN